MQTQEEWDVFDELAKALWSWKINTSGAQKDLWMCKWDISLQTSNYKEAVAEWLEWVHSHEYAEGFRRKFKELYSEVHDFYEKLLRGELDDTESRHEEMQILESDAKSLAEHVLHVKELCGFGLNSEGNSAGDGIEKESQPANVFKKMGDYWNVTFQGGSFGVKDTKGMTYIAQLLDRPNKPISALTLTSSNAGGNSRNVVAKDEYLEGQEDESNSLPSGQAEMDENALQEYKKKIESLQVKIELEEQKGAHAKSRELKKERDDIAAHLKSSQKLGGKSKYFSDESEKARKSVSAAITRALDNINDYSNQLCIHLYNSMFKGKLFVYRPSENINWDIYIS